MNRTDRLSAILIMLQTKKLITAQEIADRFAISQRTVYRDMKALDEAGVPIGAEAGRGYYLVDGYHLPPVMFTPEEAGSLLIGGKLVDKFSDQSVKSYFHLAIDKIKSVLPQPQLDFIGQIETQVHVFHNDHKTSQDFANNYLTTIQQAMSENKCLSIKYFSQYRGRSHLRLIEPLSLCFYGFKWHLISYCRLRNDFRDFRVDRIQELELSECLNKHRVGFSLSEYFKKMWDTEGLFDISVRFKKDKASLIESTKYYFGYFEEVETDKYVEMRFASNDYNYFGNWIMSLGDMVLEILQPELVEVIQRKIAELSEKYASIEV